MANLNVTYQELSDVSVRLTNGQRTVEDELSALKSAVDGLVAAGFQTDNASGAFQSSYSEFDSGVRQVVAGLEGMSSFLKQAASSYEQTDQGLASSIRG
jgi:WXG100 family type VII secretion target